jgi:hypothetical protein
MEVEELVRDRGERLAGRHIPAGGATSRMNFSERSSRTSSSSPPVSTPS